VLNSLSFSEKLVSGLLNAHLGGFVIEVKALNRGEFAVCSCAGEREHKSSGHIVEFPVGFEAN